MVKKGQIRESVKEQVPDSTETEQTSEEEAPATAPAEEPKDEKPTDEKVVNGDATEEAKKEEAPAASEVKKKTLKPVKKVIPSWASVDRSKVSTAQLPKPKVQDLVLSILASEGQDSKGVVSASTIKRLVLEDNPDYPMAMLKKTIKKSVEKGIIKQVTGKGFGGSFKLENKKPEKKKAGSKKAAPATGEKAKGPLDNLFPLVFTWACNPKEASVGFIKKYIVKNYPDLMEDERAEVRFKKALEGAESKGQLKRITGKGYSGTFQLVDEADKTGSAFEDAIENAVIAMNEPKDVSVAALRDYLGVYHPEYNTDDRPHALKKALERAVANGWLKQVTGKGFSGTYRLMYPYYPAPKELWGKDYKEKTKESKDKNKDAKEKKKDTPKTKKAKKVVSEDEESDDDDEDEDDDDAEVIPTPKKRGAPSPRKSAAPPTKKVKKEPAVKKKTEKKSKKPVVAKKNKPAPKKVKGKGKK